MTEVLSLTWASSGRDYEASALICAGLRHRGLSVSEGSVFDYVRQILKHRPKVLLISSPAGAQINYWVAKSARSIGLPVVSVAAEGIYKPDSVKAMFWGHNTGRELVETYCCQWSANALALITIFDSVSADWRRLPVTGAPGFDRYKIYDYPKGQGNTVGIAGSGLDFVYVDELAEFQRKAYGVDVETVRGNLYQLNKTYEAVIQAHPDITFLLKEHPANIDPELSELYCLDRFPNVMMVDKHAPIGETIAACDLWVAYDSTSVIEAELLGVPSVAMYPSGLYTTEAIGYTDGLNHWRVGDYVIKAMSDGGTINYLGLLKPSNIRTAIRHWRNGDMKRWKRSEVESHRDRHAGAIQRFYKAQGL